MTPVSAVKHTLWSPQYGRHLKLAHSHITWAVVAMTPRERPLLRSLPPMPPPPSFTVELGRDVQKHPFINPFIVCILAQFAITACYNGISKESCLQLHCNRFLFLTFRITFTASCFMDLHSFPHDRQSCYLKFGSCKYLPLTKQRSSFHCSTIPT